MSWALFIIGSLLFVANIGKAGQQNEVGATAFTWSFIGAVLGVVGTLYLSGVVS